MRAIKIDVVRRAVEEIDLPGSRAEEGAQLRLMQETVGGYIEIAARLPNGDTLFVDEEGLLKPAPGWFQLTGHNPFAGNGIVTGDADDEGHTTPALIPLAELMAMITWVMPLRTAGGVIWFEFGEEYHV